MKKGELPAWDLSAIKPSSLQVVFAELEALTVAIEKKRSLLKATISVPVFLGIITQLEQLKNKSMQLGCYAGLRFAEDSSNQRALADMTAVENVLTKINNRLLFFSLWFKELPAAKSEWLIRQSGKYHYYLEFMRKTKPYTLSEAEEKIINVKDITGVSALNNIYNILTSQFTYTFQGRKVTQEELSIKVRDPSARVRKEAYLTLLTKYKEHQDVLGEVYKNIALDWREEDVVLRGYKSPIQVRNVVNDIPDKAIEALLRVCEKNEKIFHRFFEVKRKKLGLKTMRRFDLYAHDGKKKEKKYAYDEGLRMVLDCYDSFSHEFKEAAVKIINANHIHSKLQKNKQSGAFCCGVNTKLPPYVLLNYTGTLRDVSTIAHELGHGVHHVLASVQTEFTHDACLPLAETASIFGEMLLSERLMAKDPARAKELLFFKLEDLYASIIRQAGFVRFERKAHEMIVQGKTTKELSDVYVADLRAQLGPKVEVDDIFAYEWLYIPHIFHTPFYCYAYAFGNLLTLALWEMYKENPAFSAKVMEMLAKGGSESPIDVTKAVGVDICSEAFWQKGFDVIEEMLERVE